MPLDPRLRKRSDSVVVRAKLSKTLTNAELFAAFSRSLHGKLAPDSSIPHYLGHVKDALAYARDEDGEELHVSLWTKEHVWEYIHYMEANYCRSLRVISLPLTRGIVCTKLVWEGTLPAETAAPQHCAGCKLFQSSSTGIEKRLQSLVKFWKFLARTGVVELNFMRDTLSEWREDQRRMGRRELRRNPSVEEMVKLVNGTEHPRNRAFYASSAKWWLRVNEMLMLDRYASFNLPAPDGTPRPAGFELGFTAHQDLAGFDQGGDLVYLPETKGALDKRKGNRWCVVDDELRPILSQYFAWWERTVQRDSDGRPVTTALWITEHGLPLQAKDIYRSLFYGDCQRLGLMTKADERDPLRKWSAHCQRHFGEKLLMMNNCPDTWSKHFRGDAVKDARGAYFVPTPDQIRQKYREWVPHIGFRALADAPIFRGGVTPRDLRRGQAELLRAGLERIRAWKSPSEPIACARIVELDQHGNEIREVAAVPRRFMNAMVAAARLRHPGKRLETRADPAKYRVIYRDRFCQELSLAIETLSR